MAGKTLRHPDLKPSHPGELLRDIVIPATGKTKVEIARLLGISRQSLYDILSETQGVTPPIALRLGKMFGDGPEVWLRMQNACDIWELEPQLEKRFGKNPKAYDRLTPNTSRHAGSAFANGRALAS